jgi:hypothetical protein
MGTKSGPLQIHKQSVFAIYWLYQYIRDLMKVGKGYLQIKTVTANGAVLVGNVAITVTNGNKQVLHELTTDEYGNAPPIELDAPEKALMEDPNATEPPYYEYHLQVNAEGFTTLDYEGVMIFDTVTSILQIEMNPLVIGQEHAVINRHIGGHKLYERETPQQLESEQTIGPMPRILPEVTIPNFIRVHLGRETANVPNVSVSFINYIKNVASHEVYDDWPEQALIANIYCIISLTLNRVYTDTHRKGRQKR